MTWSRTGRVFDDVLGSVPAWLDPMVEVARTISPDQIARFQPTSSHMRHSAVLILFGEGVDGPDLLIIERAPTMRAHAGQPAFPGGAVDADDLDVVATALREAVEETDLDPAGVLPFAVLPDLYLPVSDFVVTPVVAYWQSPSAVRVAAPAEVASVHRIPVRDLVDPARRCRVQHPSGYVGPGFEVGGLLVWGFTGMIIDALLTHTGWALPWDEARIVDIDSVGGR